MEHFVEIFKIQVDDIILLLVADGVPTVDENIIATIKMRNFFCYPLKMVIFSIFRLEKSYRPYNFCKAFCPKNDFFLYSYFFSSFYCKVIFDSDLFLYNKNIKKERLKLVF